MVTIDLTPQEQHLMKRVCELQLDSLQRILSGQHEVDMHQKLSEHKVSETELKDMITGVVKQYQEVLVMPQKLFKEHNDLLGNFREAIDFNSEILIDFNSGVEEMMNKLDLAIFASQHQN